MLKANLWINSGLINGSIGIIKEIIYENNNDYINNNLPFGIIVYFENY